MKKPIFLAAVLVLSISSYFVTSMPFSTETESSVVTVGLNDLSGEHDETEEEYEEWEEEVERL